MKLRLTILFIIHCSLLNAQDTVRYIGTTLSNVDYHHGVPNNEEYALAQQELDKALSEL